MGSENFFAKFASIDPLAQALHLPGAHKYAQQQARDRAGQTDTNGGAYTGVDATLAGANAGYRPGGPGATPGFVPTQPSGGGGLFGALQKGSNMMGNSMPHIDANGIPTAPGNLSTTNQYVQPTRIRNPNPSVGVNPWVTAARGATTQQNPQWGVM
jgi:hypothetical protein